MSRVTKRTVKHLNVVFDAEVLDADSGELLHTAPVSGRFNSGSEAGQFGEFNPISFHPPHPVRVLMLKLRLDGELWDACCIEAPKLRSDCYQLAVHPRLHISMDEFESLLEKAGDMEQAA